MKAKQIILNVVALAVVLVPTGLSAATAYAAPPTCGTADSAKGQVLQGVGLSGNDCDDKQVNQIFNTIVQVLSIIIGLVSTIVILYAGLKYMTSGGESNRVANAKNTLIYALVGLAVAALAQFMIHFVLARANNP